MLVFGFYQGLLFTLRKITTPFFSVCNAYGISLGFSNGVSLNSKTKRIASFFARQKNPERSDKKKYILVTFFSFCPSQKGEVLPCSSSCFSKQNVFNHALQHIATKSSSCVLFFARYFLNFEQNNNLATVVIFLPFRPNNEIVVKSLWSQVSS